MGRLTKLLTWQPTGLLSSWTQFTSALKFCNRIYEEVITSLFVVLFYRWILFSAACYRWIPSATVRVCVRVCDRLVTCSWGINKWACTLLNWSGVCRPSAEHLPGGGSANCRSHSPWHCVNYSTGVAIDGVHASKHQHWLCSTGSVRQVQANVLGCTMFYVPYLEPRSRTSSTNSGVHADAITFRVQFKKLYNLYNK